MGGHLSRGQQLLDKVDQLLLGPAVAQGGLDLLQKDEHLLVGQAVQRAGQTVEAGGERQVRVRQRRADQVHRVGAHVASLVIAAQKQQVNNVSSVPLSPRDRGVRLS